METELKQLRQNNPNATIKVEIVPEFTGTNKRPDRFAVRCTLNGQNYQLPKSIIENP